MSNHMPPVPPANRTNKGPGRKGSETSQDKSPQHAEPSNAAEQGETANISQNTTNEGYFRGRRVK
jgi:hypothetical protein